MSLVEKTLDNLNNLNKDGLSPRQQNDLKYLQTVLASTQQKSLDLNDREWTLLFRSIYADWRFRYGEEKAAVLAPLFLTKELPSLDEVEPKPYDIHGKFHWKPTRHQDANAEFDDKEAPLKTLHRLGVLPDNQLLSNKAINFFGDHVLEMLKQKANFSSWFESWEQERRANAKIHPLLSRTRQLEIWLCWRMVHEIEQLNPLERLFNLEKEAFGQQLDKLSINPLPIKRIPQHSGQETEEDELNSLINDIVAQEKQEWPQSRPLLSNSPDQASVQLTFIEKYLADLKAKLKNISSKAERNDLLLEAQSTLYRRLAEQFKRLQGQLSLYQHTWLPRDNWSKDALEDTLSAIQNHTFGETVPVLAESQWNISWEKYGYLDSAILTAGGVHDENLLFAICLMQNYQKDMNIDISKLDSDIADHFNGTYLNKPKVQILQDPSYQAPIPEAETTKVPSLHEVYQQFLAKKKHIQEANLLFKKINRHLEKEKPASNETLIEEESFSEYTQRLWEDFNALCRPPSASLPATTSASAAHQPEEGNPSAPLIGPVIHPTYVPNDLLSSALLFTNKGFFDYFARMTAKHRWFAPIAFSAVCLQFSGVALAQTGIHSPLSELANLLIRGESALTAGQITTQQITQVIKDINTWLINFTGSEGVLEITVTCGFTVAKLTYTATELMGNIFSEFNETSFKELAELVESGSIEGKTSAETAQEYVLGFADFLKNCGIAILFGVAASESGVTWIKFIDNVRWEDIAHPSIRTVGSVKLAALVIGKLMGINHYIQKNNITVTPEERQAILMFLYERLSGKSAPEDTHFQQRTQQILLQCPWLVEVVEQSSDPDIQNLKHLNLKKPKSGIWKFLESVGKTVFFAVPAALIFIPLMELTSLFNDSLGMHLSLADAFSAFSGFIVLFVGYALITFLFQSMGEANSRWLSFLKLVTSAAFSFAVFHYSNLNPWLLSAIDSFPGFLEALGSMIGVLVTVSAFIFVCYQINAFLSDPKRSHRVPPILKMMFIIPAFWATEALSLGWTMVKTMIHGFLQFLIGIPEMALYGLEIALRGVCFLLQSVSIWIKENIFRDRNALNKDHLAHTFDQWGTTLRHHPITGLFRDYVRYPLEEITGKILTFGRDSFIRPVERAVQRISVVETEISEETADDRISTTKAPYNDPQKLDQYFRKT